MVRAGDRYLKYAKMLRDIYQAKVYKLPVSLPVSCPNRDGRLATGGCAFCPPAGPGHEVLPDCLGVSGQLERNWQHIRSRYSARLAIAYLQNYSNTYMSADEFAGVLAELRRVREQALVPLVGLAVATRPDCLPDRHIELLAGLAAEGWRVSLELGLQTANYRLLRQLNRQHGLAEFIDATLRAKRRGLKVCGQIILNLPGDEDGDTAETARILTVLSVDEVKAHALYLAAGSRLAGQYLAGQLELGTVEEYVRRVGVLLAHLAPDIAVQRLVGRIPAGQSVWANWSLSWWRIQALIDDYLEKHDIWQGKSLGHPLTPPPRPPGG
ncbi:MAG: TIGR01212 family radical SAM protein [Negativicutes bacterium]|nr:TIGR01212 family radical SAM protein [Negativicutes bacterium]